MDIIVYSQKNCPKCATIKKELEDNGISFTYIDDNEATTNKALELKSKNKLIEMVAPIVLIDGEQVKHKNLRERIGY